MKDPTYWKHHYVLETDADEIERRLQVRRFTSGGRVFEMVCFEQGKEAPGILVSPGSGGHAYLFAELGYRMHRRGYNVFIMPRHGGYTVRHLMRRQSDAIEHILGGFNERLGVYGEGLGGYVTFYLALAHARLKSMVLQNAPAVLTDRESQRAWMGAEGAARRRRLALPLAGLLARVAPWLRVPISAYLDYRELIDPEEPNRRIETRRVESFLTDPDVDRWYPLSALMSLVTTPPPNPLSELTVPTMFLVPVRGLFPAYLKDLYGRLPPIKKRLVEADGGAFWMCTHPGEAAAAICGWFDETL